MNHHTRNLGQNIKALRLEKGWTQQDLADKLGCTQKIITAYECNTRHPTAAKIPVIAALFGVTVNELYGTTFEKKSGKAKNPKMWKRFEQLDELPNTDKRTVYRMIDGLLAQKRQGGR